MVRTKPKCIADISQNIYKLNNKMMVVCKTRRTVANSMTAVGGGNHLMMSTMSNGHPTSTMPHWVNVFGPNGYNVQPDNNRNRKMVRVHLPDVLKVYCGGALRARTLIFSLIDVAFIAC